MHRSGTRTRAYLFRILICESVGHFWDEKHDEQEEDTSDHGQPFPSTGTEIWDDVQVAELRKRLRYAGQSSELISLQRFSYEGLVEAKHQVNEYGWLLLVRRGHKRRDFATQYREWTQWTLTNSSL